MSRMMPRTRDFLEPEEIRELRQRSDWRGAWLVAHAWGVIAAAMVAAVLVPHPLVFLVGLFVVAGRQLGLAILMHDAAHGLLFKSRWLNDFFGQWFCAVPLGADMPAYRRYHIIHHKNTQQDTDPDLVLSAPFPITRASLVRKILRDLVGWTFLRTRILQFGATLGPKDQPMDKRLGPALRILGSFVAVNALMWAGLAALGYGYLYLLLWLLPLATGYQLVLRIRNIAEHAMTQDRDDPLLNTRTTRTNWFTRIFLAPYWVNYHIEHHLFLFVPCYRLERAHEMMLEKGYGPKMELQPGYTAVLNLAASRGRRLSPAV